MSEADVPDPAAVRRRRLAFRWTFGLTTAVPFVVLAVAAILEYSIYLLVLALPIWAAALLAGLLALVYDRAVGVGMTLGALAGALVGFSFCSGVLLALTP